jgi:hypothetical protein
MVKLKVVVDFKDKETLKRHFVGETIEREDARAKELITKKVCVELVEETKVTKPKKQKNGL